MKLKKPMAGMITLVIYLSAVFLITPAVYADTDGSERRVTDQPEKLVIQLGTAWAGVQFELKTDAGFYPQPIVVSAEGVLSMELGGSKTYLLSAVNASNSAPAPDKALAPSQDKLSPSPEGGEESSAPGDDFEPADHRGSASQSGDKQGNNLIHGIPKIHLLMFTGGLVACMAGLVLLWVVKRRRNNQEADWDDYEDDEEDD